METRKIIKSGSSLAVVIPASVVKQLKLKKGVVGVVDGEDVFKFNSTHDVERELKIHQSSVWQCCVGKRKSAGKYQGKKIIWKYIPY